MSYCPSQDWDRHINEQDDAAAAEALFYRNYREDILQVLCAMLAGRSESEDVLRDAANLVRLLNESGEMP